MMPAAPGKEGTSSAVLAQTQFSLLASTPSPSLAPLQAVCGVAGAQETNVAGMSI